jgi:hypothetical protein
VRSEATDIRNITVADEGRLLLPASEVRVTGDLYVESSAEIVAHETTIVFDGDQILEGNVKAKRVVMRGGVKRIRNRSLQTTETRPAKPGEAQMIVEAGATLIIENGGTWVTPNSHGFQVAGHLVIDGGEFGCTFTNGNGTDHGEKSWLPGSSLTVHAGKFIGRGDADFGPAVVTINGGAIEIEDDIWSTGSVFTMNGGTIRNATRGGMFLLTGTVSLHGGKMTVYQNSLRSLRIHPDAAVFSSGGVVTLNGSPASANDGGVYVGNSATLPDLVINTSTQIHKDSLENGYLSVAGDLTIAKGKVFNAKGFQVISNFVQTSKNGVFVP